MATRITEATEVQAVPPMFGVGSVLLDRYQVEETLGLGGCSFVLRAHDRVLDQPVAVKILRSDVGFAGDMETRLLREARAIAQLSSPHVVRIFDVGTLDGAPFVVMELLHGADLSQRLAQHRTLAPAVAVDFILQACDALGEAHALGIVHRDIKPSNLFVVAQPDGTELIKLLDFGISKAPLPDGDLSLTRTTSLLGTPAYMAPEQMRSARSADARSDVWALGTVLYQLVEGHLPITGDTFAELVIAATTQRHQPMMAARELEPVIARCLAKKPDERYSNMAELAADLAGFASHAVGLACAARNTHALEVVAAPGAAPRSMLHHAPLRPSAPLPWARRRSLRRIALVAVVVAVVGSVSLMIAARVRGRAPASRVDVAPAVAAPPPAAEVRRDSPARAGEHASVPVPVPMPVPVPVRATAPAVHRSTSATTAAPPKTPRVRPATRAVGSGAPCDPYARPDGC